MYNYNSTYGPPSVIAEIGCNHMGDMRVAKELISMAAIFGKAKVAKFQKRNPKELLSTEQYTAPHPNQQHAYGDTYGSHREFLELSLDKHRQLMDWCNEFSILYSTSVWDLSSAREISKLDPPLVKIGSASNSHAEMLKLICDEYSGEIHVSLGMTSRNEEDALIKLFESKHRAKDVVLYSCTSGYPVPFSDVCLLEIPRLKNTYGDVVKAIGFSGHHLGIAVDVAAFTLGAQWIERHFTLDRTAKGTDHAASLEPDGLRRLVRDLNAVHQALSQKSEEILPIEAIQREKLKYK
jgi:N-acetylneuraminate synthase